MGANHSAVITGQLGIENVVDSASLPVVTISKFNLTKIKAGKDGSLTYYILHQIHLFNTTTKLNNQHNTNSNNLAPSSNEFYPSSKGSNSGKPYNLNLAIDTDFKQNSLLSEMDNTSTETVMTRNCDRFSKVYDKFSNGYDNFGIGISFMVITVTIILKPTSNTKPTSIITAAVTTTTKSNNSNRSTKSI
ncbi:hypothetical protein ACTFIV_003373 [Dictyostelium citrinum]